MDITYIPMARIVYLPWCWTGGVVFCRGVTDRRPSVETLEDARSSWQAEIFNTARSQFTEHICLITPPQFRSFASDRAEKYCTNYHDTLHRVILKKKMRCPPRSDVPGQLHGDDKYRTC
jgi:hypothetical protein